MASVTAAAPSRPARSPQEGRLLFWGILLLAFVSVLVPTGPARPEWFFLAIGLAAVVGLLRHFTPWSSVSERFHVVPLLFATAAIGCLIASAGKSTGLGSLVLLPLLFSAFYGVPWESYVVIPAIGVTQTVLGISNDDTLIVLIRILVFWMALLVMISLAAHALRRSLQASVDLALEEARQSAVVAEATRELTGSLDRDLVIAAATRLAAELVAPSMHDARRGQYFEVSGDVVTIVSESDVSGMEAVHLSMPAKEHPMVRAVLASGAPVNGPIAMSECGPALRETLERFGITHAAYVPISFGSEIGGILSASARGEAIQASLFERLQVLGSLTELAIKNASAHQLLEEQALTDPLTKLANRRELERAFARLPDRLPFAYVAIDLDGLKSINDQWGHAAGDAAIVAVATAIARVSRRGDTVSRVGGDEFAVLMLDASVNAAERLAGRIHEAVTRVDLVSGLPRLSIGCCVAQPGGDTGLVQGTADSALYEAKRRGGSSTVTQVFEMVAPALIA